MQAINTLRDLGEERASQEAFIRSQEKKFRSLVKAIENNALRKGLSEDEACGLYGEPLLIRQLEGEEKNRLLIFTEPITYFVAKKAYLYFDSENKLVSWEVK